MKDKIDCKCMNWARDNIVLLSKHHPKCELYNIEEESRKYIEDLLFGIAEWANDEDGIHPECFEPFKRAAYFIGRFDMVKDAKEN